MYIRLNHQTNRAKAKMADEIKVVELKKGSVQNRINSLEEYKLKFPYPKIKKIFEIHIFMFPLNPSPEIIKKYLEITDFINKLRQSEPGFTKIKPCLLALDYRGKGYVNVMQSARYFGTDNIEEAIKETNREADLYQKLFNEAFETKELKEQVYVVREKLETLASSEGVPQTDSEALKFPKYFEFHIRVKRKNTENIEPITAEELAELNLLSLKFTELFKTPLPISYNQNNEHQRYLNVRFRNVGSITARERVSEIVSAIEKTNNFAPVKIIAEYVPYDSFTELDRGWIDF